MDYKKLTEASLDEIMNQIRQLNNTAKPEIVTTSSNTSPSAVNTQVDSSIEVNADMAVVEQYLANAVIGKEIGVKKSPMYAQRGIKLKMARVLEKVYLRIAEFSNRYVRDFNGLILSATNVLKEKIKVLFHNDHVLWDNQKQISSKNEELGNELHLLKTNLEIANNLLENKISDVSRENTILQLKLEQQAAETERVSAEFRSAQNAELEASINKRLDDFGQESKNVFAQMEAQIGETLSNTAELEMRLQEAREAATGLEAQVQETRNATAGLEAQVQETRNATAGLEAQVQETRNATADLETQMQEKTAVLVEHLNRQMLKIRELEEKMAAASAKLKWVNNQEYPAAVMASAPAAVLEDPVFYHDFEERFRGTQEDIRERLEYYLPMLMNHFGSFADKRFVDIGCGRGEWMDMISDNGAKNYIGVDINPIQLDICKQKGHPVIQQNCMEYLADLSDESVDMISGIQIIEHLSLDSLLALLSECYRVLRPQGMILFETPNSGNLITATNWFYVDPTHNRPIHKEFARFLVERSGYKNVEILELNPAKYAKTLVNPICFDGNQVVWDENIQALNNLLYGPQDFAVVGVKGNE